MSNLPYRLRKDEIQGYVNAGMSNPQIADRLCTTPKTVGWLLVKLGIQRTPEQRQAVFAVVRPRQKHTMVKALVQQHAARLPDSALDAIAAIVHEHAA